MDKKRKVKIFIATGAIIHSYKSTKYDRSKEQ